MIHNIRLRLLLALRPLSFFICIILIGSLVSGCARPVERPILSTPLSLEMAVRLIAFDLFAQIKNNQSTKGIAPVAFVNNAVEQLKNQQKFFAVDAVMNADTGEEIELNSQILEIVQGLTSKSFPNYEVVGMNSQTINQADYVIVGIIKEETYNNQPKKIPHLFISAVDMANGQVVAHSEAWIAAHDMKFEPTTLYSDSPMFMKDSRTEKKIATAKASAGEVVDQEYFSTLETDGLLAEAAKAYDSGDYEHAIELFNQVASREDGQAMKTYAGLYQAYFRIHQFEKAEKAFAELTAIGIQNGNLSVKFLFQVDATDFFGQPEEITEYHIWLRQIAKKIDESQACVEISGHASRSGSAAYNKRLSDRRAHSIKRRLLQVAPAIALKSVAVGRGFEENIVGSGTDDIRDSIDRRVEFRVYECE